MHLFHGGRTLTRLDAVRLHKLVDRMPSDALDELLAWADTVDSPQVPSDVLTMYSQFEVLEAGADRPRRLTLCYPDDAEPAAGFISVLSPVGSALLGLRVGDTARWTGPGGQRGSARVLTLLFQPEASGDYTT
ncbi:MAG: GreA/GreB family elongation factor [Hydrogenophaga sp.]|nr:GreA/GreB family elongation factor [Hydrogenophaga sp.]